MNTLLVAHVEGEEATTVTLRSNTGHSIEVFCHPCSLKAGDQVENRLSVLDGNVQAAYLSDWPEDEKRSRSIERLEKIGSYAYRGCGKVVDSTEGLVEVFGFLVEFSCPLWGEAVEFEATRLDCQPNIAFNPDALKRAG